MMDDGEVHMLMAMAARTQSGMLALAGILDFVQPAPSLAKIGEGLTLRQLFEKLQAEVLEQVLRMHETRNPGSAAKLQAILDKIDQKKGLPE